MVHVLQNFNDKLVHTKGTCTVVKSSMSLSVENDEGQQPGETSGRLRDDGQCHRDLL